MTKSTITREQLLEIIETDHVQCGEASYLARMALAAMDSEPVAEVYQAPNVGICAALGPSIRMLCPLEPGTKLYRHAQPAPVVPEEMTPQQASRSYGGEVRGYRAGWNACRAVMLAAAPQSPGSEPATVPGKWIPVSEQKPDCWCLTCRPVTLNDMRFVVCPDCGNKRCPRANDHRNACTRSNEPGQEGSAYPAAPQEVRGE
ncbi:TPA: hypothetical protein MD879_001507 [Escherichia coli]|nr:hypothetical protein [Escherichia coli]